MHLYRQYFFDLGTFLGEPVEHIWLSPGTTVERLCWQVFVDDAGAPPGLSELVHFAESPNLANLKKPEVPVPVAILKTVSPHIPFQGMRTSTTATAPTPTTRTPPTSRS